MVGLCTNQWGVALVQEDHNTTVLFTIVVLLLTSTEYIVVFLSFVSRSKEALSAVLAFDKDLVWPWHRHEDQLEISFLGLLGTNYSNAHEYGVDV